MRAILRTDVEARSALFDTGFVPPPALDADGLRQAAAGARAGHGLHVSGRWERPSRA